jgi:hypothetical protein
MLTEPWKHEFPDEDRGIGLAGFRWTVSQVTGCAGELRNVLLEPQGRYHRPRYGANRGGPAGPGTTKAAVRGFRMAAGMP